MAEAAAEKAVRRRAEERIFLVVVDSSPEMPVALRYETPAGHPAPSHGVCWWGDMTFGPHLWRLLMLPWVRAEVAWGDQPLLGTDRKALAAALQREVAARFTPVRQETAAAPAASVPDPAQVPGSP